MPCASRHLVSCSPSRVVPGAHGVVGPSTHLSSGPRDARTTRGDTQRPGIDFDRTFSPVVKSVTIRTVLTLSTLNEWLVHQLDVSNAFLHSDLKETVYCQ
jgi:hypothetical protein